MGGVGLEPRIARALCRLEKAFTSDAVPHALVGASALLLRGVQLDRATRDLDFVVAVRTASPGVASVVRKAGFVQSARVSHRFTSDDGQVDVLPLDDHALATGRITFPEGGTIPTAGLPEAVRHASAVSVGACAVQVAPLPILVALKLVAARERRLEDRDLRDAFAAMRACEAEGDRRFLEVDYGAHPGLLFETAGAFLLARDLLPLLEASTAQQVTEVVADLLDDARLGEDRTLGERCAPLLRAFVTGLGSSPPSRFTEGHSTLSSPGDEPEADQGPA